MKYRSKSARSWGLTALRDPTEHSLLTMTDATTGIHVTLRVEPDEAEWLVQQLAKPLRWKWLRRVNDVRAACFGDGSTTSGLVQGEDGRTIVAAHLNQLQADLGIPSNVEPS